MRASGRFTVALSGGSTPKALYSLLATKPDIPWDKIYFFWGDERHVPPDHPESNYRMANEALLSKVPVRQENIFRIHAEEKDAAAAALQYEQAIKDFFHLVPRPVPAIRSGPPGHWDRRAHGFPFSRHSGVKRNQRLVVANWVPKFNTHRITFTFPGPECRRLCNLSGQRTRQSADSPRGSGEQGRGSAVAKGAADQRKTNLGGG